MNWLLLAVGGLVSGILAGFLGIGGGTVLVPFLVTLGYTPLQAVATSSLAVLITATSGSIQNWRMGYFRFKRVVFLGFSAPLTAQIGVYLASRIASYILLIAFGFLLLINIYLVQLHKTLTKEEISLQQATVAPTQQESSSIPIVDVACVLAGLFALVGGEVMVLQILFFGSPVQLTYKTSLGIIIVDPVLLIVFGMLLLVIVYLLELRQILTTQKSRRLQPEMLTLQSKQNFNSIITRIAIGGAAGFLAGLFGMGGGVILVPLQILLLREPIKVAIQTSLGVIVITAISACIGQALNGNVLFVEGIMLGIGGLVGAQFSTRYLPKLPDRVISIAFRLMLAILSLNLFWQAWQKYVVTH